MLDIFAIHRDADLQLDWFTEFETQLSAAEPSLNQKMLFTGPGLARNWHRVVRAGALFQELHQAFADSLLAPLTATLRADVNIIDLGVGDFSKADHVISHLLRLPVQRTLSYFPLDISYELVWKSLATGIEKTTLVELKKRGGRVAGIHADFSKLSHVLRLFRPRRRHDLVQNVYLLLGNTLGNLERDDDTLRSIAECMAADDLLVLELQIRPLQPATDEDRSAYCASFKSFFGGPFLALGCDRRAFDLFLESKGEGARGEVIDKMVCRFKEDVILTHPSFVHKVHLHRERDIVLCLIRKYSENCVHAMCTAAGLEVVQYRSAANKFCYVICQRSAAVLPKTAARTPRKRKATTMNGNRDQVMEISADVRALVATIKTLDEQRRDGTITPEFYFVRLPALIRQQSVAVSRLKQVLEELHVPEVAAIVAAINDGQDVDAIRHQVDQASARPDTADWKGVFVEEVNKNRGQIVASALQAAVRVARFLAGI